MAKIHHRHIRINGKIKKSPPFKRASDANRWYQEKLREKQHLQSGLPVPLDGHTTLRVYFQKTWLPNRKREYTKATWGADEQRFRDYVDDVIGGFKVSKINTLQIRHCLLAVTQKHGRNIKTRNHVRTLLSKIFGDAMIEERPLRTDNPALGIKFKDPRIGSKKPVHISKQKDIEKYLTAAQEAGPLMFAMVCTFLMAAPRKSELIALKWSAFDIESKSLTIAARFVQAENVIMKGSKAGREEERIIHIPDTLVKVLIGWRSLAKFTGDQDFIFHKKDGSCIHPRAVNRMIDQVRQASGVEASPHALRHSFGRWFVANGGDLKALQTIMGHSNYSTTEIYAELVAEQVKRERNRVSFEVKND